VSEETKLGAVHNLIGLVFLNGITEGTAVFYGAFAGRCRTSSGDAQVKIIDIEQFRRMVDDVTVVAPVESVFNELRGSHDANLSLRISSI
jgi:hypothetical protein